MGSKSLSKLKDEMIFNQSLTKVVDVMKGISAAQYFVMEHKKLNLEKYSGALDELFQFYDFRNVDHPFLQPQSDKKLICLVTTDSGFLGGLNMKVATAAMAQETPETEYVVLGERGVNYMKEMGRSCDAFPGINPDDTRFEVSEKFIRHILKCVWEKNIGRVILVHPYPVSFTSQRIEVLNLLPCPMFYKDKPESLDSEKQDKGIILDSKPDGVIEYLTLYWLRRRMTEIFEDSKMAEYGARTMHLEESYSTLTKLDKTLRLQFFKAKREKIDQSLRETFSAKLVKRD